MLNCNSYNEYNNNIISHLRGSLYRNGNTKDRFPLPELTARVNGPSWRVTDFHYPSTRAMFDRRAFPLAELWKPGFSHVSNENLH